MARWMGEDQLPAWKNVEAHPAYDGFWQSQALDKLVGAITPTVPTMWLQGLWDQEDMWGAIHSYRAVEPKDTTNTLNYLVMGPWFHSQVNREAGCANQSKPLYLGVKGGLSFEKPAAGGEKFDEYVSDPAKPVPYVTRPVTQDKWRTWLVDDQRFVDGRPDVLVYTSDVLTAPVRVSGTPVVNLYASTSGTDSDWVVKVIDVYPENAADPAMSGYELSIATDIFRGRYRKSFEHPEALKANEPELFKFDLPQVNHIFEPGHKMMIQVQSTLFPLYDRNPQRFVPNIFDAKTGDYQKATQRVWHSGDTASFVSLPVVP